MFDRYWFAGLLALVIALSGCSGNYTFSDDEYRPLGDPQAVKRGN
ncbi:MAG: type VI secretion protein [Pseudomonas sp.]